MRAFSNSLLLAAVLVLAGPAWGAGSLQPGDSDVIIQNPAPPPPVTTGDPLIQIVNATSVARLAVELNGKPRYPEFLQGEATGAAPWNQPKMTCSVTDLKSGLKTKAEPIPLGAGSQTVLIIGDLSTDSPADTFPVAGASPDGKIYPPSLFFRVYPFALGTGEAPQRYRFVNAMPRTLLTVAGSIIQPGDDLVLAGQPNPAEYQALAAGQTFRIYLKMMWPVPEIVVFYLKNGKPAYLAQPQM